jgi:hypothetical protein
VVDIIKPLIYLRQMLERQGAGGALRLAALFHHTQSTARISERRPEFNGSGRSVWSWF